MIISTQEKTKKESDLPDLNRLGKILKMPVSDLETWFKYNRKLFDTANEFGDYLKIKQQNMGNW